MNKRMYFGGMIAAPAMSAIITLGYWADPAATWLGWMRHIGITDAIFVLGLTGAFVAFGKPAPRQP